MARFDLSNFDLSNFVSLWRTDERQDLEELSQVEEWQQLIKDITQIALACSSYLPPTSEILKSVIVILFITDYLSNTITH